MPESYAAALDLATRMLSRCPCDWTAEERNRIIAFLVPQGGMASDFPLQLKSLGSSWQIIRTQPPEIPHAHTPHS